MNHLLIPLLGFGGSPLLDGLRDEGRDKLGWTPFKDPKTDKPVPGWLVKRIERDPFAEHFASQRLCEHFYRLLSFRGLDIRPRFYWQTPGFNIPAHVDRTTLCSINFVLEGEDGYVAFPRRKIKARYSHALLNTQEEHGVLGPDNGRLLFKLSIFNRTYNEVAHVLQAKLPCGKGTAEELRADEAKALSSPQDGRVGDTDVAQAV